MLKQGTRQDIKLIRQGSYQGASDVQDHIWWDTQDFQASTVADYSFFVTPIGVGKPKQQTNLQDAGKFPTGQSFVTNAVGFHFLPKHTVDAQVVSTVVADFYTVMREANVDIIIAGREFDFQSPASAFLPPIAVVQQTEAGAVGIAEQRIGDFNNRGWLPLKTPITISELVSFKLLFSVNNSDPEVAGALTRLSANDPAQLRWCLRGTLERLK